MNPPLSAQIRTDNRLSVVVVGGGVAGAAVVRGLSSRLDKTKYRLVLITSRPCHTYLPGALRLLASPDVPLSSVFMSYDKIFGKFPGEIIVGTATSIEENKDPLLSRGGFVVVEGGQTVMYDALVIATGSSWVGHLAFPNKETEFKEHVSSWRKKIQDAQHIVIVGGGAVGIEVSGEIKDSYPSKDITIVHANRLLLGDMYPETFRTDVEDRLRRRGVSIIFNDTIEGNAAPKGTIRTSQGVSLPCDLLIHARGGRPNASLLKFLRPSVLTDRGYVKVTPKLQVESHQNIFALGDIIDWPEAKQLTKISMGHAPVVINNVMNYLEGRLPKKAYRKTPEILAISIGRGGGASYLGYLWGLTFGSHFTRYVKSVDLMVGFARRSIGLPAHCEKEEDQTLQRHIE
ncbi:FAD/NAD(P)-binding domain-containing protein [Pholiota conissans]|uniref:FAD/NAD(P)-binding domain-containing protein n=1 Tax=Pholiota conissans TaxID=109636 RepID=A0A9P5YW79_9AGAR|nr:FAD/NAD(P)-binding domain-containing protein [Pholiota conissans]